MVDSSREALTIQLLETLDAIALEGDGDDYGLPWHDAALKKMEAAVEKFWQASRSAAIEECAAIAEYHHENHCTNNDTTYHNCGTAIATGIRDLRALKGEG